MKWLAIYMFIASVVADDYTEQGTVHESELVRSFSNGSETQPEEFRARSEQSDMLTPPGHHEIIAGVTIPGPIVHHFPFLEQFWAQYKVAHSKLYSKAIDLRRKRQWIENLIRIHKHNEEARNGTHSYYLRANHLSDMNVVEYILKMVRLAHRRRKFIPPSSPAAHVTNAGPVPQEINWVDNGFVTPVWDQRDCGSCYAFSIAASVEGQYFRKTEEVQSMSVQQIVDCSLTSGNLGCNGGSLGNTFQYCVKNGLTFDSLYPYSAKQHLCKYRPDQRKANVTSYVILPQDNEAALEHAVATIGPVAVSINASPHTFQLYHKGIYDDPSCSSKRINHAMLVVGYTKDAWILKNWWGSHWGMDGYMHLRKGKNRCAVAKYAGYPILG